MAEDRRVGRRVVAGVVAMNAVYWPLAWLTNDGGGITLLLALLAGNLASYLAAVYPRRHARRSRPQKPGDAP